jgi:hypothetical protein
MHLLNYTKFNKVLKCSSELHKIHKEKNLGKRIHLIKIAENCVIDAISEIAKNCLLGNIPLSPVDFTNLKKYQQILRKISKSTPIKKRKQLIIQKGGFIETLIPAALALIAYLIKIYSIQQKSIKNE